MSKINTENWLEASNNKESFQIVKFSSFPEPAEELMFANSFVLLATVSNSV